MTQDGGPWGREPPEKPAPRAVPRHRRLMWLGLLAATGAGVWLLFKAFPRQVSSAEDWGWVAQGFGLMVLVSAGILSAREIRWGEKARHAAIWLGIVGVLVVGFAYQDDLAGVGQRVRSEFSSSYPVATGAHQLVVAQGEGGGFYVMGQVNGQLVRFLIDTGSSDTVLSPADAQRVGVNIAGLRFDHMAETANGTGYGAPFTADSLAVGPIRLAVMPMVVNQAPMSSSLLGMSFLGRLESFQVKGRRLYLTSKG